MPAFKSTLLCAAALVASVSAQSSFTFVAPGATATAPASGAAAPQSTGTPTGCVDEVLAASTANGSAAIAEGWDNAKTTFTAPATWTVSLPTTGGYVAIHFNEQKCRDLSKYQGLTFDLVAPASGAFNIAWTPRNPDCSQIQNANKNYLPAAKYITGTQVALPFFDFSGVGFSSIEDLTLINFTPATTGWKISNITLRCSLNKAAASAVPTAGASKPAAGPGSASNSTTPGSNSSAGKVSSAGAVAAAAIGAAVLLI